MTDITVSKKTFQYLHSAARALFQQALQTENHSAESLVYLQLLNEAIDAGHDALGTHRPSADQYVNVVGGITRLQAENAQAFLKNEGYLDKS
jgi:hypothetical protein